jgi:hypothetical protein
MPGVVGRDHRVLAADASERAVRYVDKEENISGAGHGHVWAASSLCHRAPQKFLVFEAVPGMPWSRQLSVRIELQIDPALSVAEHDSGRINHLDLPSHEILAVRDPGAGRIGLA